MVNKSNNAFYEGASKFGYAACQWIEWMSEKTGRHINHALCGHEAVKMYPKPDDF